MAWTARTICCRIRPIQSLYLSYITCAHWYKPVFFFLSKVGKNVWSASALHSKITKLCWHFLLLFGVKMILIMAQQYPTREQKKLNCSHGFKASCFVLGLQSADTNGQPMTQLKIFSSGFSSVQTPCQQSPQCCSDVGATMAVCLLNCKWDEC